MTANDLINSSLRLIGVLASGEVPSAVESSDALMILNDMLDSWNAERMMIFTITISEFALIPGQQVYTLGPAGNFNAVRPAKIERIGIVNLSNPAQPLELPMEMLTDAEWAAIPVKVIQSSLPQKVYDDGAFPLRNLSYWCIPNVTVKTRIYGWTALTSFSLMTQYSFPPAYSKALRYNLALDLAPEYGRQVPPEVAAQAVASKGMIKSINAPIVDLHCDPFLVTPERQIFNWLTGESLRRG